MLHKRLGSTARGLGACRGVQKKLFGSLSREDDYSIPTSISTPKSSPSPSSIPSPPEVSLAPTVTIITTPTPLPQSVITTTLTSLAKGTTATPQAPSTTPLSKSTEQIYPMGTSSSVTPDSPPTVVEYTTIISSFEISSGVYSPTNLVMYTTRVFTPATADSTDTVTSSPVPSRNRSKGPQIAIIAGASVGGTLSLVTIGFLIFFYARRSRGVEEPEPEFIPAPVREPTPSILPPRLGNRYRNISNRPISKLSSTTSPVPKCNSAYGLSHIQAPAYNGQPMAEVHAEEYRQTQEMGAQKYEYPVATYELPSQKQPSQHPYAGPRGQGYGRNIGQGY